MKTKFFTCAILALLTLSTVSCGTSSTSSRSTNPFGQTFVAPSAEHDTDEYFAALGIASGSRYQMGEVHANALSDAQNKVRMKLSHSYKGRITNYSNAIGNKNETDIQKKLENAGTQIIDAIVNDTRESVAPQFSEVDDKGYVTCFVNIRVYKDVVAKKIAEKVADAVSDDEEMAIRFKEAEFRKQMEESFKQYKEENK